MSGRSGSRTLRSSQATPRDSVASATQRSPQRLIVRLPIPPEIVGATGGWTTSTLSVTALRSAAKFKGRCHAAALSRTVRSLTQVIRTVREPRAGSG